MHVCTASSPHPVHINEHLSNYVTHTPRRAVGNVATPCTYVDTMYICGAVGTPPRSLHQHIFVEIVRQPYTTHVCTANSWQRGRTLYISTSTCRTMYTHTPRQAVGNVATPCTYVDTMYICGAVGTPPRSLYQHIFVEIVRQPYTTHVCTTRSWQPGCALYINHAAFVELCTHTPCRAVGNVATPSTYVDTMYICGAVGTLPTSA